MIKYQFNKFHNTGAGMLDSTYHMTLKVLEIRFLRTKIQDYAIFMLR